jgi:hypothetical protein
LSLTIDHCTAESSAKEVERIILGDYLVNSKLLLGRSIADNDGYETLGLRRAMVCQKKKLESRVDYGRRGFETALKKDYLREMKMLLLGLISPVCAIGRKGGK